MCAARRAAGGPLGSLQGCPRALHPSGARTTPQLGGPGSTPALPTGGRAATSVGPSVLSRTRCSSGLSGHRPPALALTSPTGVRVTVSRLQVSSEHGAVLTSMMSSTFSRAAGALGARVTEAFPTAGSFGRSPARSLDVSSHRPRVHPAWSLCDTETNLTSARASVSAKLSFPQRAAGPAPRATRAASPGPSHTSRCPVPCTCACCSTPGGKKVLETAPLSAPHARLPRSGLSVPHVRFRSRW